MQILIACLLGAICVLLAGIWAEIIMVRQELEAIRNQRRGGTWTQKFP
jgi:hypothetical protein